MAHQLAHRFGQTRDVVPKGGKIRGEVCGSAFRVLGHGSLQHEKARNVDSAESPKSIALSLSASVLPIRHGLVSSPMIPNLAPCMICRANHPAMRPNTGMVRKRSPDMCIIFVPGSLCARTFLRLPIQGLRGRPRTKMLFDAAAGASADPELPRWRRRIG